MGHPKREPDQRRGITIKVNQTIKTEHGTVEFKGELTQEELDYVVSVGLNYLLQQGALPFQTIDEVEWADMAPGSDVEQ